MKKTMEGWNESHLDLSQYLAVGDTVDEKLYWYFIEVLPPATMRANLVQIGEPVSHVDGRATFATLYKPLGAQDWIYAGNCHRGEWMEAVKPARPKTDSERLAEAIWGKDSRQAKEAKEFADREAADGAI